MLTEHELEYILIAYLLVLAHTPSEVGPTKQRTLTELQKILEDRGMKVPAVRK